MGSPPDRPCDHKEPLREARTPRERLLRALADAAMSVTHHDAHEAEPGYIHEVEAMEKRFALILRGKLVTAYRSPSPRRQHDDA